jgi:hypothetical protein
MGSHAWAVIKPQIMWRMAPEVWMSQWVLRVA